MKHVPLLISLVASPALAQEATVLRASDLAVQTHRWEGEVVETTLNCFYADKQDYRCYDAKSFARVRVDFVSFDSDGEAFLQRRCDRIDVADTDACRVTLRFTYQSFDVMPSGDSFGDLTLIKPIYRVGIIVRHAGKLAGCLSLSCRRCSETSNTTGRQQRRRRRRRRAGALNKSEKRRGAGAQNKREKEQRRRFGPAAIATAPTSRARIGRSIARFRMGGLSPRRRPQPAAPPTPSTSSGKPSSKRSTASSKSRRSACESQRCA